ncbi:MAG: hypothetical protein WKF96_12285 [Solirubrobacteraceae bacterium]
MNCSRCERPLPIDLDALAGVGVPDDFPGMKVWNRTEDMPTEPASGFDLPLIIAPVAGSMMSPDDPDGLIHRACATLDEISELTPDERKVAYATSEKALDA